MDYYLGAHESMTITMDSISQQITIIPKPEFSRDFGRKSPYNHHYSGISLPKKLPKWGGHFEPLRGRTKFDPGPIPSSEERKGSNPWRFKSHGSTLMSHEKKPLLLSIKLDG